MSEVRAAALADVAAGAPQLVEVAGRRVVLARVGDRVYACADTCSHRGGPLGEGKLQGVRLICPWHGYMYDVRTGQCVLPARGGPIDTYPARVADGEVWVDLP